MDATNRGVAQPPTRLSRQSALSIGAAGHCATRPGLDAATPRADVLPAMDRRLVPQRPLLALLPLPARRATGAVALTLTLWLASLLALFR
jgi:hypothetical protein